MRRNPNILCIAISLQIHAASPIHRDDLAGDIRRIGNQESHRSGDVFRLAGSFEQCPADDMLARGFIRPLTLFRPQNGAGRNSVYPDFRRKLLSQRSGKRRQAAFCSVVYHVSFQRPFCVNIHDVDDAAYCS